MWTRNHKLFARGLGLATADQAYGDLNWSSSGAFATRREAEQEH